MFHLQDNEAMVTTFLAKYEVLVNNRCKEWLGMSTEEYQSRSLMRRLACVWNTSFCRSVGVDKEHWVKRPNKRHMEGITNRGFRNRHASPTSNSKEEENPAMDASVDQEPVQVHQRSLSLASENESPGNETPKRRRR